MRAQSAALVPLCRPASALASKKHAALLVGFDPVARLAEDVGGLPGVTSVGYDKYGAPVVAVSVKPGSLVGKHSVAMAKALGLAGAGLVASVRVRDGDEQVAAAGGGDGGGVKRKKTSSRKK